MSNLPAEFITWLGTMTPDQFNRLSAVKRYALHEKWKAEADKQTPAAKLEAEMVARFGSLDSAREKGTPAERIQIDALLPTEKPKPDAIPPLPAAVLKLSASKRLAAAEAWPRMYALLEKMKTARGDVLRHHEVELQRLVTLHPELKPPPESNVVKMMSKREIRRQLFGLTAAVDIIDSGVLRDGKVYSEDIAKLVKILRTISEVARLPWPPPEPAARGLGLVPDPEPVAHEQFPPAPLKAKALRQPYPRRRA